MTTTAVHGTATVSASVITGARTLEVRDVPLGPPPPGTVTVEVSLCGVCGTEVGSWRSGHLHSPAVCGHEWVGTVSAVGEGAGPHREGDRVVVGVVPPCGRCAECAAGLAEQCATVREMTRGRDALAPPHGAFASHLTVAAGRAVPAHPGLSDVQAAQVEPTAVALHGIRRSGITPGDVVVVQGAGPIGLLAAQLARVAGAGRVLVVEPAAHRRELALRLGAESAVEPGEAAREAVLAATRGLGADVVVECAGVPALLQTAVGLARRGGRVALLSFLAGVAEVDAASWLAREVTVVGAVAFTREDVLRSMAFLADGRVAVEPLHTRTVGLDRLAEVLDDLAGARTADVKVLVDPRRAG